MEHTCQHGPGGNERHTEYSYYCRPCINGADMRKVGYPLLYKVAGDCLHGQSKQVLDLCGEDSHGDTRGKAHYYGVGDILDDGSQTEYAQQDEEHACHQCGNSQSLHAVLLDNAVDNDDKGTRRTTNLHFRTSEERNHESCNDGCDDTLLRAHTTGNTEGNSQRKCHDAHNDAGHEVGHEGLAVVIPYGRKEFWFKI